MSFIADDGDKIYSTNEIYKTLKIPFRYLRKQMTVLSKTGLIKSKQGKFGGYRLSKKAHEISLYEIISLTEVSGLNNECFFGYQNCVLKTKCNMHDKWVSVRNTITETLKTTSLNDIKDSGSQHFMLNNNLLLT